MLATPTHSLRDGQATLDSSPTEPTLISRHECGRVGRVLTSTPL
jgi:hypothetical protein